MFLCLDLFPQVDYLASMVYMTGLQAAMVVQMKGYITQETKQRTQTFSQRTATTVPLAASTTWVISKNHSTPSSTGLCIRREVPPTSIHQWSTTHSASPSKAMSLI